MSVNQNNALGANGDILNPTAQPFTPGQPIPSRIDGGPIPSRIDGRPRVNLGNVPDHTAQQRAPGTINQGGKTPKPTGRIDARD